MNRYSVTIPIIISILLLSCRSSVHFFGTPENEVDQWEAEEELIIIQSAVNALMAHPETPIIDLMTDPRVACSKGDCVMCDGDPTFAECTQKMADVPGGLITLSDNPGEAGNQVKPLTAYIEIDIAKHAYCVHPDGRTDGFLQDGTRIEY